MKLKIPAFVAVGVLTAGLIALVAGPASAHDHTDDATCQAATVDLTNYDAAATAHVELDGVVLQDGTFVGGYHLNQALTFDAGHQSHTLTVVVVSGDAGYSFSHTDVTPGNCYTPPPVGIDVPIVAAVFHPATCTTGSTFDVPVQTSGDVKYTVTSPPVGDDQPLADGVSVTIEAHVKAVNLLANGGLDNPNDYSVTFTGQAPGANGSCAGIGCQVTGPAYAEAGDHFAELTADGYQLTSQGDATPVDLLYPLHWNLQGVGSVTYTDTNVVGNGIFFRLIVDLSADGGSAYNSFSIVSNTVDQSSVANVGSKAVFLGKTIAQVAALYPHNVIVAGGWETGSAYAAGDGALLTGFAGDCGSGSYVAPPLPETTVTYTDWTDGDYACPDTTVEQTRTKETTTYSYDGNFAIASSVVDATETQTRNLTADEITAENCPIVTPTPTPTADPTTSALATTGSDGFFAWLAVGILAVLFAAGLIVVGFIRRRTATQK